MHWRSDIMPDQLLGWLKFSIELEQKGLDYYARCNAQTKNSHAQALFKFLIDQELKHKDVLQKLFDAVTKGDKKKIRESVAAFEELHLEIPVFNIADIERMQKPDVTLSEMINNAINMESEGIKFYQEIAQKEDNVNLKFLFNNLFIQETEHKNIIKKFGFKLLGLSAGTLR
jgi:rubrerythrin